MQLIIDLPSELESRLREQDGKTGAALNQHLVGMIREKVASPKDKQTPLTERETRLFQKINAGFTEPFWERLRVLDNKRIRQTLSEPERIELINMTGQMEVANLERMKALIALAEIRQIDLDTLMKNLEIEGAKYFLRNTNTLS